MPLWLGTPSPLAELEVVAGDEGVTAQRQDALLNPQRALVDSFAVGDRHACQFDVLVDDRLHRSVERPDHQLEATESLALEFG